MEEKIFKGTYFAFSADVIIFMSSLNSTYMV